MSLRQDISTALWFAAHPGLYPQLGRSLRRRLWTPSRPADEPEQAARWCAERAVSIPEALRRLTGTPAPASVRHRHAPTFAEAEAATAPSRAAFGGEAALDLLYWLSEHLAARRVIETGVAHGWSSLALLLSIVQRDGQLLSTDMPYPFGDRRHIGRAVPAWLQAHWSIIRRADGEAVPRALRRMPVIDLCHYDSDKTYDGRLLTYPRLWAALRPGGGFISDDIGDNFAFREFADRLGVEPTIARTDSHSKYIGVLIKPGHSSP